MAHLSEWMSRVAALARDNRVPFEVAPLTRDETRTLVLLLEMLIVGANLVAPWRNTTSSNDPQTRYATDGNDSVLDPSPPRQPQPTFGEIRHLLQPLAQLYVPFWTALDAVHDTSPETMSRIPWPPTPLSVYLYVLDGALGATAGLARGVRFGPPYGAERAYGLAAASWDMLALAVVEPEHGTRGSAHPVLRSPLVSLDPFATFDGVSDEDLQDPIAQLLAFVAYDAPTATPHVAHVYDDDDDEDNDGDDGDHDDNGGGDDDDFESSSSSDSEGEDKSPGGYRMYGKQPPRARPYRLVVTRKAGTDAPWVAYLDDPECQCVGCLIAQLDAPAGTISKDTKSADLCQPTDGTQGGGKEAFAVPTAPYRRHRQKDGAGAPDRNASLDAHLSALGDPTFTYHTEGVCFRYSGRSARGMQRFLSAPEALYGIRRSMAPDRFVWPTAVCALLYAAIDAAASCDLDVCPVDLWPTERGRCEAMIEPEQLSVALATRYDDDGGGDGGTTSNNSSSVSSSPTEA